MRACPNCRKEWPADHEVCPDCLAALVDDLDATVTCRSCGHVCPSRMQTCSSCFALLRVEDIDASALLEHAVLHGVPVRRPPGVEPFAAGPGGSVRRLTAKGPLVVCGSDGFIEAAVAGPTMAARPPLTCSVDGVERFRLEAYGAAADALVVIGVDGAAMATFLRQGKLPHTIDIRDETSAPVARLVSAHRGGYEVIETGGDRIASVATSEIEWEGWDDDEWSVSPIAPMPLRDDAVCGLVVATKVLLGRAMPTRRQPPDEPEIEDPFDL